MQEKHFHKMIMKSDNRNNVLEDCSTHSFYGKNISDVVDDLLLTVQNIVTGCAFVSNKIENDYLEFQIRHSSRHPTVFVHYQMCLDDAEDDDDDVEQCSPSSFQMSMKNQRSRNNNTNPKPKITSYSKFNAKVKEDVSKIEHNSFDANKKILNNSSRHIKNTSLNQQTNISVIPQRKESVNSKEIIVRKEIPEHLSSLNFNTSAKQSLNRKEKTFAENFRLRNQNTDFNCDRAYDSRVSLAGEPLLRNHQSCKNEIVSQFTSRLPTKEKPSEVNYNFLEPSRSSKFSNKFRFDYKSEEVINVPSNREEAYVKKNDITCFEISDDDDEIATQENNEGNAFLKLNKEIELIFQDKTQQEIVVAESQNKDDDFREIVWLPVETILGDSNGENDLAPMDANGLYFNSGEKLKEDEISVLNYKSIPENTIDGKANEKFYKCKYCEKTFDYLTLKWQHEVIHRPHSCNHCDRTFAHKCLKVQHEKIHVSGVSYSCSYCDKSFSTSRQKNQHEKIHTRDRPYMCRYCKKSFANASRRAGHELIHTGERPYSCNYCGKSFNSKSSIHRHQRIHTGEKPYSCRHCDKRFANIGNKNKHERLHLKWGF